MDSEQLVLEGVVENIIYHNSLNGYTVFSIIPTVSDNNERLVEITCTALIPQINEGEDIRLSGSYILHPTYGRQFNVAFYEKKLPTSTDGISKYLASGVIKGVGEKTAKRIVDKFGEDTLFILEETPERLVEVKGISMEKALSIGTVFQEQSELRNVMMFLQRFDISAVSAQKIYKKYKENTIDIVSANPFLLADDIAGIGFKTADMIAARLGMEQNSMFRIKAGIKYTLNEGVSNGHVYLPKIVVLRNASGLLSITEQLVEDGLVQMQFDRTIWQEMLNDETIVYLNAYYYAESYVAKKLLELSQNVIDKSKNVDKDIIKIEQELDMQLAANQKTAVVEALSAGVLVITGGPGTGKTTTINTIIRLMQKEGYDISLAAPTGRAAKRMTETTGIEAKTIHRLLESNFSDENGEKQHFEKNEDTPLETDVLIIDESSMVDIMLMYHLLKAVPYGSRLILVGDVDQLPSVGAGNVLKDIIQSEVIPIVRLTEIFRQAQESAIVMNAHRINKGEYPKINEKGKDFFFVKRTVAENVISSIIELVTSRLPEYVKCNPNDIQVLTPMRKSPIGVAALNQVLQQSLNPPNSSKQEKEMRMITYREGDKVMQIKNNYNMVWRIFDKKGKQTEEGTGIFNGDEGIIAKIDDVNEIITVRYDDDKIISYDYSQLDELELSYAITIHKSQGSEYGVVVIPIHSGPPMLLNRNLLYTAITRAKKLAVIVGIPETLYKMVDNNHEVNRYTSLCSRIVKMDKLLNLNGGAGYDQTSI